MFVSQPLRRVIAALDRWRPGKLVLASAEIADRPVTLIVDVARSAAIVEAAGRRPADPDREADALSDADLRRLTRAL
ncbi:hypothetical protein CQW49_21820 (plasmid) [Methylosinus trichosporium OB3b]|uniref:Uncharacterized protein n=1 Tax=Methylosinus trichosporium (strain ATCC 35070 / NCIMB 11131 / UNIQEM 75 / OB3b) TaxID=595536 RepID=A0A2D2D6Z9_METT3|nr:hypothetical protein [Methylosinus trichosporium]ATQ70629.1 hypothetical protein CQW49_21820 [Methylosinus trichosporium OB3b]